MQKKLECITLENGQEYAAVDKIKKNDFYYVYLFNTNDVKDFCIRKLINDKLYGLDTDEEFDEAIALIGEKNKDLFTKIGL